MEKKLDPDKVGDGAPGLEPCTHSADPESARAEALKVQTEMEFILNQAELI